VPRSWIDPEAAKRGKQESKDSPRGAPKNTEKEFNLPFRVDGEKAHGPGIHDMKADSFMAFHAVRSIRRQGVATRRPIVLLLTPDVEVGSPTSRECIEREARGRGRQSDPCSTPQVAWRRWTACQVGCGRAAAL
jgi:hypothetical protein